MSTLDSFLAAALHDDDDEDDVDSDADDDVGSNADDDVGSDVDDGVDHCILKGMRERSPSNASLIVFILRLSLTFAILRCSPRRRHESILALLPLILCILLLLLLSLPHLLFASRHHLWSVGFA